MTGHIRCPLVSFSKNLSGGLLISILAIGVAAQAGDFHVNDGPEFQAALDVAAANGEDDTIYMAAGVYDLDVGFLRAAFSYGSSLSQSLTIMPEAGVTAGDVVLDGHDRAFVLEIHDFATHSDIQEINVIGLSIIGGNDEYQAALDIQAYDYDVNVMACNIRSNESRGGNGGGASITCFGNLVFEDNLLAHNRVDERLRTSSTGSYLASEGGGALIECFGRLAVLRNNVFAYNNAEGERSFGGGLVYTGGCVQVASFINNTFYANHADEGGGFFAGIFGADRALNLYNNIVYGNTATNPHTRDFQTLQFSDTLVYAFNNDYSAAVSILADSGGNMDVDPAFVDAPGLDFRLRSSSPLIDEGMRRPPAPGLPDTDFEGDPRICDRTVDIGADEFCDDGSIPAFLPVPRLLVDEDEEVAIIKRFHPFWLIANLSPAGYQGVVEWWISLEDPKGDYLFLTANGWSDDPAPYFRGPAQEIDVEVLIDPHSLHLNKGLVHILTAVDAQLDGQLAEDALFDAAVVIHGAHSNKSDKIESYWRWGKDSDPKPYRLKCKHLADYLNSSPAVQGTDPAQPTDN